jgi:hypothetical protein
MIFIIIYVISVIYCLYKLSKRADNMSLGGGIGESPALDTLMSLLLAPFLAFFDILFTILNYLRKDK